MSVTFRRLTDDELGAYLPHAKRGYVHDLTTAGALSPERAAALADKDFDWLVVQESTEYFGAFDDVDGVETLVGVFGVAFEGVDVPHEEPTLHLYDLEVFEPYRRRGYGLAILGEVRELAIDRGAESVRLTVWAGNDGARELYRVAGFAPEHERLRYRLSDQT
jgi:ribosomal protein S18 acetylase RimI-like enzyme